MFIVRKIIDARFLQYIKRCKTTPDHSIEPSFKSPSADESNSRKNNHEEKDPNHKNYRYKYYGSYAVISLMISYLYYMDAKLSKFYKESKAESKEVRNEMKDEMTGMKEEIKEARKEMKNEIIGMKEEIKETRKEMKKIFKKVEDKTGEIIKILLEEERNKN